MRLPRSKASNRIARIWRSGLALPGIEPKKVRASMKLFAEKVIRISAGEGKRPSGRHKSEWEPALQV